MTVSGAVVTCTIVHVHVHVHNTCVHQSYYMYNVQSNSLIGISGSKQLCIQVFRYINVQLACRNEELLYIHLIHLANPHLKIHTHMVYSVQCTCIPACCDWMIVPKSSNYSQLPFRKSLT